MYLSMAVFQAGVAAVIVSLLVGILKFFFPIVPIPFIPISGFLAAVSVYVFLLIYPSTKVGERKRKFDASLPTAASYMAAMSSAGVNPDEIFYSLSREEIGLFISQDAQKISRDIKVFGLDIIRALENAARRSPSAKYATFLEGINATNTSGGDLQGYFENASKTLMRDKVQTEKSFIELLGLFAELFLVACIVTPTFGIVLIAMVALQGTMTHTQLMTIIITVSLLIIPIMQLMIMVMVDGSQPVE
jgi:flagellar protein FlaJ